MLELLVQLLGATGAAIGILYLLYKQIVEKVELSSLTKKQTFSFLIVLVGAIWTFAVFVILSQGGIQFGTNNFNNISGEVSVQN